jgi:hypothetical protein
MKPPQQCHVIHKNSFLYDLDSEVYNKKKLHSNKGMEFQKNGDDLLSHNCCAVPSALAVLTSLFGMGRGGTPPQ